MKLKINNEAKKAIMIGSMCAFSYLAVYIARNILSAVTPQLEERGVFSTESIGTLSSIYFVTYAIGQLINGIIGDKIKAKYMISLGLILAGIFTMIFTFFTHSLPLSYIFYGTTGFFLSMIYAPMTKVVSENTTPIHATRCSLGYTFASFAGSPAAGVLAAFLVWQGVFTTSGIILILMGLLCFAVFTFFERKGIVQYGKYTVREGKNGGIRLLIKKRIIRFTLVSIITGIIRTTVVFWLPTYLSQALKFSTKQSALLFTVSTLAISSSAFIAIFVYERLHRNTDLTLMLSFIVAAVSFLLVFFIGQPTLNILFMILAIIAANCAATMLWSMYCPSLRDTGMVSSATGFLDFMSYIAAAISSTIFANAVSSIGWNGLILVWFALMVIGTVVVLPLHKLFKKA